jgi:hypothetical protein
MKMCDDTPFPSYAISTLLRPCGFFNVCIGQVEILHVWVGQGEILIFQTFHVFPIDHFRIKNHVTLKGWDLGLRFKV